MFVLETTQLITQLVAVWQINNRNNVQENYLNHTTSLPVVSVTKLKEITGPTIHLTDIFST